MSSGIYYISCHTPNGIRFYWGQAQDVARRKREHWSDLRNNKHYNQIMQRRWNKYGPEAFAFKVILECPVEELDTHEQTLLDMWVGHPQCMNVAKDARIPTRGLKFSEEAKAKMTAAKSKPVYALLPDGSCIFYRSAKAASLTLGVGITLINHYCNGSTPQPGTGSYARKHTSHIHGWQFSWADNLTITGDNT